MKTPLEGCGFGLQQLCKRAAAARAAERRMMLPPAGARGAAGARFAASAAGWPRGTSRQEGRRRSSAARTAWVDRAARCAAPPLAGLRQAPHSQWRAQNGGGFVAILLLVWRRLGALACVRFRLLQARCKLRILNGAQQSGALLGPIPLLVWCRRGRWAAVRFRPSQARTNSVLSMARTQGPINEGADSPFVCVFVPFLSAFISDSHPIQEPPLVVSLQCGLPAPAEVAAPSTTNLRFPLQ